MLQNVQAIAYCGPVSTMKNPCNEFEIGSYEHRFVSSAAPVLKCPKGYVMQSCNILHPWAKYLKGTSNFLEHVILSST